MRIIFVGGGNIAESIFAKLNNFDIIVIQRNIQKLERLKTQYPQISFQTKLDFITHSDDLIFLSVKPQDARSTCESISHLIQSGTIISVMAGISCQTISKWLNISKICRVMPNTASILGLGVSGFYFNSEIDHKIKEVIIGIFSIIGKAYPLTNEDQINQITAIAASSPAYIFYFIEGLINAATSQFGFDQDVAKDITLQVIRGSIAMIEHNQNTSIQKLRENVTSKKGTTEQALGVFEQYNLIQIINEAEKACYNRAKELSQMFDEA